MKVLALDVGERRIGIAVSDTLGLIASPIQGIVRTSLDEDITQILAVVAENNTTEVLVGLPYSLLGGMGPQAKKILAFTEVLRREVKIKVKTIDERYSTLEAKRLMKETGVKRSSDKLKIDSMAASVILQTYLDSV